MRPHRDASHRLVFRRAPLPWNFSLSLFLSLFLFHCSLINASTMTVQFWCDSLDFSREFEGHLVFLLFLVFRPFFFLPRSRVSAWRWLDSTRAYALCVSVSMCVRVSVHVYSTYVRARVACNRVCVCMWFVSIDSVIFLFGDRQISWLQRTFDLWCVLAGSSSISAMGMTYRKWRKSLSIGNP